jgi:hypothetical protein
VDAILLEGTFRDIAAAGLLLSAGEPSAAELLSAFDVQHQAGAGLAALITKWRNECGATNVVRMVQSIVPELACNDRVQDGAGTTNFHKQQAALALDGMLAPTDDTHDILPVAVNTTAETDGWSSSSMSSDSEAKHKDVEMMPEGQGSDVDWDPARDNAGRGAAAVGGMSGREVAEAAGATAASATGAAGPSLGSSLRVQRGQATQQFLIKCATCALSGRAYHMQNDTCMVAFCENA